MLADNQFSEIPDLAAFLLADGRATFPHVARLLDTTVAEVRRLMCQAGVIAGDRASFERWVSADARRLERWLAFRHTAMAVWKKRR